jgi:hypothetical protein
MVKVCIYSTLIGSLSNLRIFTVLRYHTKRGWVVCTVCPRVGGVMRSMEHRYVAGHCNGARHRRYAEARLQYV